MIQINVKSDISRVLGAAMKNIGNDVREKVTVRALNKTAVAVRTEAARELRKIYAIRARTVREGLRVQRASKSALFALVIPSGRPIPLLEFSARETRRGVTVKVKQGQRQTVRGGFIATMPGGARGVFKRSGQWGRRGNPKLEKIKELFSISLPSAMSNRAMVAALVRAIRERFPKIFQQELRFALRVRGAA